MKTTKNIAIFALFTLCLSCSTPTSAHKYIAPLPAGIEVHHLQDCTVPASFTNKDFNWMGGNLSMTVYNQDLYDAIEVSQMQVGDTLLYAGAPIVIRTLSETSEGVQINGGQIDKGGCCLAPYEGGTYIAKSWDNHATYTSLGKTEVALDEHFILIDCGANPTDPMDTIRTNQKLYIEQLKDSRATFQSLNTRVTIEKGLITEINRCWIP